MTTISNEISKETPPPYGGLCLDPPERIEFKQQNAAKNHVKLIIKNPTQKRIAFSVSATGDAPKRYRIRPSRSILYPGQSEKVEISLRTTTTTTTKNTNAIINDGDDNLNTFSSKLAKFDFKNDRFEVKYFYFDEHEKQQQTADDTDTISIFVSLLLCLSLSKTNGVLRIDKDIYW